MPGMKLNLSLLNIMQKKKNGSNFMIYTCLWEEIFSITQSVEINFVFFPIYNKCYIWLINQM